MEDPPFNQSPWERLQVREEAVGVWVTSDLKVWHIAKLRQHAQDPIKFVGRSGFEGGFVSRLNFSFAELLRRLMRGGGCTPGGDAEVGTGVIGTPQSTSSQPGPKGKSPHISLGSGSGERGTGPSTSVTPEPRGGVKAKEERDATMQAERSSILD
jgi:hypothetical protein